MIFEVVSPIDGFENEKEFKFEKMDEFFSIITAMESKKELRLMSFGALKSLAFEFPEDFLNKMKIENLDDISIFYIFVLQTETTQNSLNTFAPIILNHKTHKIGQLHLDISKLGLDSLNGLFPNFKH